MSKSEKTQKELSQKLTTTSEEIQKLLSNFISFLTEKERIENDLDVDVVKQITEFVQAMCVSECLRSVNHWVISTQQQLKELTKNNNNDIKE